MIIDGTEIAQEIRKEIKEEVSTLESKQHTRPGLAVVLVGEDPASKIYVRNKQKACQEVEIHSEEYLLPANISQEKLLKTIDNLNDKPDIHGILVQLPLPEGLDKERVVARISPAKDVDGFNPVNLGNLFAGQPSFMPCTPLVIIHLVE